MTDDNERALLIPFDDSALVGILHEAAAANLGLVFVPGGDQYRVGSHRLYVTLARHLARIGVTCLRFDPPGRGDSVGARRDFSDLLPAINAAAETLKNTCRLKNTGILGLCDGASAALIASPGIPSLTHLVLINPWVKTTDIEAHSRVTRYYPRRLVSRAFWRRLLTGKVSIVDNIRDIAGNLRQLWLTKTTQETRSEDAAQGFLRNMKRSAVTFTGTTLVVLSEKDLVAQQFSAWSERSGTLGALQKNKSYTTARISGADHTFSGARDIERLEATLTAWVESDGCGLKRLHKP